VANDTISTYRANVLVKQGLFGMTDKTPFSTPSPLSSCRKPLTRDQRRWCRHHRDTDTTTS
jgi:hypothetical protein